MSWWSEQDVAKKSNNTIDGRKRSEPLVIYKKPDGFVVRINPHIKPNLDPSTRQKPETDKGQN